ncbi:gaba permease [Malassezia pachydermatis]|uniref:Gaba permease n=1 Tax=Malassezia pachydermatis TaxID=77020 RepID=A0A0M9VNS1_9BASI|nr:gaba permease [Malassezia pachydermatis]KOS13455.1 gaba permease [Malassezia pachydermatis]
MGKSKEERAAEEAAHLEAMGQKQELHKNFSFLSLLGLAFAILNSWTALSVSMQVSLPSGGPSSVIWGLITAGVGNLCVSLSLGEFLSAYPIASGQYYWTACVCPPKYRGFMSYFVGWLSAGGWVAMNATGPLLGSQLITGLIYIMDKTYEPQRWQQFCLYLAFAFIGFFVNVFGNRLLPIIDKVAFYWSLTGFIMTSITVLACASPEYPTGTWVYTRFVNETGWPNGFAWLLGLLQGAFGLAAYDSVAHMIEEIPKPRKQGPLVMVCAVLIGIMTGFLFLSSVLFGSGGERNLQSLIDAASETALITIYEIATNNRAGAVCLTMFPLICMVFTTTSLFTASSRMVYAFARDDGLFFSKDLAKVDKHLHSPVNALCLSLVGVIIFGCVYIGSASAFNAISSAAVVWLNLSYIIPIGVNLFSGRKLLPDRPFRLPNTLGYLLNIVGLLYVTLTTVLFHFPPFLPVTGDNMNYCVVAFAILEILCLGWWLLYAMRHYKGPAVEGIMPGTAPGKQPDEMLVTKADGEKPF